MTLTPAQAMEMILREIRPLESERVPLMESVGRVLAEGVVSPVSLPPWDNSAMDGYAVRADDVRGASTTAPVRLPVSESVAAGSFASTALQPGTAVRIMTGAPMPAGADSVIRVEDTLAFSAGASDVVTITDDRDLLRNIRLRGEDLRAGDEVLHAREEITAARLGVLASIGSAHPTVYRRPRVAIAGSGDELVQLHEFKEVLAGRKIVSSNSYTLIALVAQCGAIPVDLGIARDSLSDVREMLERARGCDMLITTAGVSVGDMDYTRTAIEQMGARDGFWRVRMRPGAQTAFAMIGDMPWLGLPGNPVSTMITFELFAKAALRRMSGLQRLHRQCIQVRVTQDIDIAPAPTTYLLRAIVTAEKSGGYSASLTGPQGSGILTSMSRANALLILPENSPAVRAGDSLNAILLNDEPSMSAEFPL